MHKRSQLMNTRRKNEKGMSLVEIMLAVAIFVIGAVSVIHLFVGAQISLAYTLDKSQAMLLAKEGIEKQRALRNGGDITSLITINENILLGDIDFSRSVDVSTSDNRATVTSTVEWTFSGDTQSVSFTEVITDWK